MKIFYISSARIPTEKAHGIQIMQMCKALSECNVFVKLIVPKRFNPNKEDPFIYYDIEHTFDIEKIFSIDLVYVWRLFFKNSNRIFFWIFFWIREISFVSVCLVRVRVDKDTVVYTRDYLTALCFGLFYKNVVLELHNLPRSGKRFFYKLLNRLISRVVVITNGLKDDVSKYGYHGDILVAPDGVDIEKFDIDVSKKMARQNVNLPEGKKIVLYSGSFFTYTWKGVDTLLAAAKNSQRDDVVYVFVGGSDSDINKINSRHGVHTNIVIRGKQPHSEVPLYLKAADILVIPNEKYDIMSERYTSPLKLFEYMAAGRPVVASDISSMREILDEESAYFFCPGDSKDLSQVILGVLDDSSMGEKRGRISFNRVHNYTWDTRVHSILNFLKYE